MRVWAISDLHVDYEENMSWIAQLSQSDYSNDVLLVAGDISDDIGLMERALSLLMKRFGRVFFVPGNHDLWVRKGDAANSVEKFYSVLNCCAKVDVATEPEFIACDENGVTIVPLFAWYVKPEEGDDSLFLPKPGEDPSLGMWVDNYATSWPEMNGHEHVADMFLSMNRQRINGPLQGTVISFSHFLPRQELIFPKGFVPGKTVTNYKDPAPSFNFSRVAGSTRIDEQLRTAGASAHIYGHQHRDRYREIEDVIYISHGLGYPRERERKGIKDSDFLPLLIWECASGFKFYEEY